ncbi:hypothetical protein AVEN_256350-1, partial [Araneus ventricosus]
KLVSGPDATADYGAKQQKAATQSGYSYPRQLLGAGQNVHSQSCRRILNTFNDSIRIMTLSLDS